MLAHPLWKASYSCRIGLASNLASTVAIANPIHCASVRFPSDKLLRFPQGLRIAIHLLRHLGSPLFLEVVNVFLFG